MVSMGLLGRLGKMAYAIKEAAFVDKECTLSNIEEAEVLIDFTSASSTIEYLKLAEDLKKPLIIGTTGLSLEIEAQMSLVSKKIPLFYSPNFSLGIAACMQTALTLSKLLEGHASIQIEETHHVNKKDAPSGTALKFEKILQAQNKAAIPIKSIRLDEVIGEHKVFFVMEGERIELSHFCHSREVFAKGVLQAAKFLPGKPPGIYGMKDLFSH
jgi:4-hydroxy-tetrahydrodipicolinate reductase